MDAINNATPSKRIIESVHSKLVHNNFACDSPFRFLPHVSTPPSKMHPIRNPFEPVLVERLHTHFLSPSVFTKMPTPNSDKKFKWTIDEISHFKPADIDETSVEQFEKTETDETIESSVQAKIESYFNTKEIVPSPFNAGYKSEPLLCEKESLLMARKPLCRNNSCQTILTLPPKLPEELEALLKPYFTYNENQQQGTESNNSLYRNLFDFHEDTDDTVSVCTSPAKSLTLSPSRLSLSGMNKVHNLQCFDSPMDPRLRECTLSPIQFETSRRESKSATRLNFTERMSVDNSINLVPDTLDQVPQDCSLRLGSDTSSPPCQPLSTSEVNWDMEYKQVQVSTPSSKDSSMDEMDVSNSNTPRSKIFISQRKKLSDSFLKDEEEREDKDIHFDFEELKEEASSSKKFIQDETHDTGYLTGGCTMSEDSSWSASNLFASTPTKKKF